MRREGAYALGAPFHQLVGRLSQRTGSVDDVVDDDDIAAFHFTDRLDAVDLVGPGTGLVADHDRAVKVPGIDVGPLGAAHIGSRDGEVGAVLALELEERIEEVVTGVEMVDREIEEALNLVGVEVAGDEAVGADDLQEVGNDLGTDGDARLVLAVLPGPAIVRQHRQHLVSGSPLGRVNGEQELHQVVCRREGRLQDETGRATDALGEGGLELPVAELGHLQRSELNVVYVGVFQFVDFLNDLLGEVHGRPAAEKLQLVLFMLHFQGILVRFLYGSGYLLFQAPSPTN